MVTIPAFLRCRRWWAAALLILVLAVVAAIRIRLLSLPLERDEGEYAYAGQLLLQGIAPYQGFYSMKWPGTFAAYALSMGVFGQSVAAIHCALLLCNLLTTGLIFLIGRRVYGPVAACVAAGTYALLSISPATLGLAAHASHFVLLPALGGVFVLQSLDERSRAWRVFIAGLLLGLAPLMKQSGAIFGLFAALWLLWLEGTAPNRNARRLRLRLGCLAAGALLPFGLTCSVLALAGVFGRFWFWTIKYGQTYAGLLTPLEGIGFLKENGSRLFHATPGLWCLALLGLAVVWFDRRLRSARFFLIGFALFSFLSVCPGWYFREHYFLQLLPAAGLLAGVVVAAGDSKGALDSNRADAQHHQQAVRRHWNGALLGLALFVLSAAWSLFSSRGVFFQATPEAASHLLYPGNAFPECFQLGRYLAEHCPAGGRLAVLGSEPELFFYSHCRSASGYVYMYPLMEPQPYAKVMQEDMIRELVAAKPDYVVFVGVASSWLPHPDSDLSVMTWFEGYRREHLCPAALVQLFSDARVEYDWSPSNKAEVGRPKRWLEVYKTNWN